MLEGSFEIDIEADGIGTAMLNPGDFIYFKRVDHILVDAPAISREGYFG